MFIIIIHELGHVLAGLYYRWKIEKIVFLPFGGITIFNVPINNQLKEELFICIMGPIFQIIYFIIVNKHIDIGYIHYPLLIFNLLPIIPLDGSKLLVIGLNKLLPFKTSYRISILISYIFIFLLFVYNVTYNHNILFVVVLMFLFIKTSEENSNLEYVFNKFLLERLNIENKHKLKIIRGLKLDKMMKERRHLFLIKNKYYLERNIIIKKFDLEDKI